MGSDKKNPYGAFRGRGRISIQDAEGRIDGTPHLNSRQKEYAKSMLRAHHHPSSPHITEKEVDKVVKEMTDNPRDSVNPQQAKKIKEQF